MRGGRVGGLLFVVGVADSGKLGRDGRKRGRRICRIMVDVASRGWRKKKVGYGTDGLNNKEVNKQKKNGNNGIDGITVEEDCNCH